LCAAFRIGKSRTTPFHPHGNGACERLNATNKKGLNKVLRGKSPEVWDNDLRHVLFTYNSCVHTMTRQTPFSLMFGEEPRIFAAVLAGPRPDAPPQAYASRQFGYLQSAFAEARRSQNARFRRAKDKYDLGACKRAFRTGDQVRLLNTSLADTSKFRPPWTGPHTVRAIRGTTVEVEDPETGAVKRLNHDRLSNPLRALVDGRTANLQDGDFRPDLQNGEGREAAGEYREPGGWQLPAPLCAFALQKPDAQAQGIVAPDTARMHARYDLRAKPRPRVYADFD
jgi:hypothetical protein